MKLDLNNIFTTKSTKTDSWGNYDFDKPSLVAIAYNNQETGSVIYAVGGHINMEMKEAGISHLDDLGLHPPGPGIWVWEGIYVWYPGSYEYPMDGDYDPSGKWRLPTEDEWKSIKEGKCPWNDEEWKLKPVLNFNKICENHVPCTQCSLKFTEGVCNEGKPFCSEGCAREFYNIEEE